MQVREYGWRSFDAVGGSCNRAKALRAEAETLLMSYPLKAADALQLAAAWTWCAGNPQTCVVISGDAQLLEAAAAGRIPDRCCLSDGCAYGADHVAVSALTHICEVL